MIFDTIYTRNYARVLEIHNIYKDKYNIALSRVQIADGVNGTYATWRIDLIEQVEDKQCKKCKNVVKVFENDMCTPCFTDWMLANNITSSEQVHKRYYGTLIELANSDRYGLEELVLMNTNIPIPNGVLMILLDKSKLDEALIRRNPSYALYLYDTINARPNLELIKTPKNSKYIDWYLLNFRSIYNDVLKGVQNV